MATPIQFVGIKAKDYFYLSKVEAQYYAEDILSTMRFDGRAAKPTQLKSWVCVAAEPSVIARVVPEQKINLRYELKDGYTPNDELPAVVDKGASYDDDHPQNGVIGLYELKYEITPARLEPIEFQMSVLDEIDNFQPIRTDFPIQTGLLDQIRLHPVLHPHQPCRIASEDLYKLVRDHVKANINPKVATITSDYDFCLTVKKRIALCEPAPYTVDVNNNSLFQKRKRKPLIKTFYLKSREVVIYQTSPKGYGDYPTIKSIVADSYPELQEAIEAELDRLMEFINEPIVDCPECHGRGVVLRDLANIPA